SIERDADLLSRRLEKQLSHPSARQHGVGRDRSDSKASRPKVLQNREDLPVEERIAAARDVERANSELLHLGKTTAEDLRGQLAPLASHVGLRAKKALDVAPIGPVDLDRPRGKRSFAGRHSPVDGGLL